MAQPRAEDVVEDLVHQFSDPFAFYRELIQNSIDAGSSRIEVTLSFRPGPQRGLLSATVADWGEGMNRRLIEDYLVTKFRSTKENDFTKIGKFGIGFVSVFACDPDAVVVDTGRDGESWRVLFKKDRTYELLASREVLEGTRVTLHKEVTASEYEEFVERSFESVKKWCRYSEADIAFSAGKPSGAPAPSPTPVREEVKVDSPFEVEHREEGTLIVMGISRTDPPLTGFYNRGLTLLETHEPFSGGCTVRVVSRYLEHTLTRDNVRRDKHFQKVVQLAAELGAKLLEELPEQTRLAAQRPDGADDWQTMFRYASRFGGKSLLEKLWGRVPGGGAVPMKDVAKMVAQQGALTISPAATKVTQRLAGAGLPVLEAVNGEALANQLALALETKRVLLADEAWTFAEPRKDAPKLFAKELTARLKGAGLQVEGVTVAELEGAARESRWALIDEPGVPVRRDQALAPLFGKGNPKMLCLNLKHREVHPAAALFGSAPRLASVLLARCVLASAGKLNEKLDTKLMEDALA